MKIIGISKLHQFCLAHADCRNWIENWLSEVKSADWSSFHDIKARYPAASLLERHVVIFNVRGNSYRLVTQIAFQNRTIAIKWIGTHAEYDKQAF